MKARFGFLFAVVGMLGSSLGCGDGGGISKKEMDSIKESPAMTDADRAKIVGGMQEGADKARTQETEFAKTKTPEELAQINADRARMGRPPLGGG